MLDDFEEFRVSGRSQGGPDQWVEFYILPMRARRDEQRQQTQLSRTKDLPEFGVWEVSNDPFAS